MENRDSGEGVEEERAGEPAMDGSFAGPPRAPGSAPARPKVWPAAVALLVLAVIIWMLLERFSPPGAFSG